MQTGSYRYHYAYYYDCAIKKHKTGFKPALAGTGIGKTGSIPEVIFAPHNSSLKSIYLTNKKYLLEAMKNDVEAIAPGSCALIYPDPEAVLQVMHHSPKDFDTLVTESQFQTCLRQFAMFSEIKTIEPEQFLRTYQFVNDFIGMARNKHLDLDTLRASWENQARTLLQACKQVMLFAKDEYPAYYDRLLQRPITQDLFPCIRFRHDPHVKMLLLTIHKAYMGFFDGESTCYLTQFPPTPEERYVIFLDECDFLEPDLVNLICGSTDIDNPFQVLKPFYEEMTNHRIPFALYPEGDIDAKNTPRHRDAIKRILQIINDELIAKNIDYPRITAFTCEDFEKLLRPTDPNSKQTTSQNTARSKKPVLPIFQTRHTIYPHPLYLYPTIRSFELTAEKDYVPGSTYPASYFFQKVNAAYRMMIDFFKHLFFDDPIKYREILQQCFDYSTFKDDIERLIPLPSRGKKALTQRATLLDGGYDFYDIKDPQQVTDTAQVKVRHYCMYTSPEKIVATMAKEHLVFGLSATLDIPRVVRQFDLDWLRSQHVLREPDDEDRSIIQTCNTQKAQARNTTMHLETIPYLQDATDPYQQNLEAFIQGAATDTDFGKKTVGEHLKNRVRYFFSLLIWMCDHAEQKDSLLLFLTTYHQIKLIFDRYSDNDPTLFTITKQTDHDWFHIYTLQMQQKTFLVVFYDAKVAKNIRQQEAAQLAFDQLFWHGLPVVVVTQYLSAGIGINLQYRPSPNQPAQDFTHLGLLETPYYYFGVPSPTDSLATQRAIRKANIWYQAKLYTNKLISERQFRQRLETSENPEWWNIQYRKGAEKIDALCNDMSSCIQALGRIERTWLPMPSQTVFLSSEVEKQFREFCKPTFSWIHQPREVYISENLRQIFALIRERYASDQQALLEEEDLSLVDQNQACLQEVQRLLNRLEAVRQGHDDTEAPKRWKHLRHAILRHDFQDELLQDYHCVASSLMKVN